MIESLMGQTSLRRAVLVVARRQLAPESGSIRFVGHLPFANYARLLKSSHLLLFNTSFCGELEFARCHGRWLLYSRKRFGGGQGNS